VCDASALLAGALPAGWPTALTRLGTIILESVIQITPRQRGLWHKGDATGGEESGMYTFVRTVSGMPGKHAELWTFAHKVKAYAKEKCDFDMDFSTPIGGDPNRIAFISITPSLAE